MGSPAELDRGGYLWALYAEIERDNVYMYIPTCIYMYTSYNSSSAN